MPDLQVVFQKYSGPTIYVFILGLIIGNLLYPDQIQLTFPLVALLTLLVLLPYVQYIQRLKWGPFEAELDHQIENARDTIEALPNSSDPAINQRRDEIAQRLYRYLEDDPKVAISALWIELEAALKAALYNEDEQEAINFGQLFRDIQNSDIIDKDLYINIRKIRDLRNQALHGGEVTRLEAREIIKLGLQVLGYLYYYTDDADLPQPEPVVERET